ncbi:MAG: Plug domain-containing protein [Calditrichia bacterium]
MNDVLSSVPGLFLQSRYGNHDVRISIRGFGSRSNSGIRGVRILLDGIPESSRTGKPASRRSINAVGRIEIVKGNASSSVHQRTGGDQLHHDVDFDRTFGAVQRFRVGDLRRNGFKYGFKSSAHMADDIAITIQMVTEITATTAAHRQHRSGNAARPIAPNCNYWLFCGRTNFPARLAFQSGF